MKTDIIIRLVLVAGLASLCGARPAAAQDRTAEPDWIIATNKPCKIWNPSPQPNESVTWSGACKDGFASGKGILRWTENGQPDAVYDGEYENGKRNGAGTLIMPDGKRQTGLWSNDEAVQPNPNAI